MTDRMSHEEYVASCRARAVQIANGILAGELPLLVGCHLIDELRAAVDVPDDDPDFLAFNVIQSETDALPIGRMREHWAPKAANDLGPELEAATQWASAIAVPACKSLVTRFGA